MQEKELRRYQEIKGLCKVSILVAVALWAARETGKKAVHAFEVFL